MTWKNNRPAGVLLSIEAMRFPSDVVAAGVSEDLLLVYKDKLGYWLSLPSGWQVNEDMWIDLYWGRSADGITTYADTSLSYSAIGPTGIARDHHVPLAVVADGCWFS